MGEQLPARVDRPRFGGRLLATPMEDIRLAAHDAGIAADRADDFVSSVSVVYPTPAGNVVCTAHPSAESRRVDTQPPWTTPIGL